MNLQVKNNDTASDGGYVHVNQGHNIEDVIIYFDAKGDPIDEQTNSNCKIVNGEIICSDGSPIQETTATIESQLENFYKQKYEQISENAKCDPSKELSESVLDRDSLEEYLESCAKAVLKDGDCKSKKQFFVNSNYQHGKCWCCTKESQLVKSQVGYTLYKSESADSQQAIVTSTDVIQDNEKNAGEKVTGQQLVQPIDINGEEKVAGGKDREKECYEKKSPQGGSYFFNGQKCVECADYTQKPEVFEKGYRCTEPTCTGRDRVTIQGKCEQCPDHEIVNVDAEGKRRSCKMQQCQPNEKVAKDGSCKLCTDEYTRPSADKKSCEYIKCHEPNYRYVRFELDHPDRSCEACPQYESATLMQDLTQVGFIPPSLEGWDLGQFSYGTQATGDRSDNSRAWLTKFDELHYTTIIAKTSSGEIESQAFSKSQQDTGDGINELANLKRGVKIFVVDKKTCKSPTCQPAEKITQKGECEHCGDYERADRALKNTACARPPCESKDGKYYKILQDIDGEGLEGECEACQGKQIPNHMKEECVDRCNAENNEFLDENDACKECTAGSEVSPDGKGCHAASCDNRPDCGKHNCYLSAGGCEKCESYKTVSEDLTHCITPTCGERQYITEDGTCEDCDEYKSPELPDKKKCIQRSCGDRQFVRRDGQCADCAPRSAVAEDKRSCFQPSCKAIISETGECVACPDYQIATGDKVSCKAPQCSEKQIVTLTGDCRECDPYERRAGETTITTEHGSSTMYTKCEVRKCGSYLRITPEGECRRCQQGYVANRKDGGRSCIDEEQQAGTQVLTSDQLEILEEIAYVQKHEDSRYQCETGGFSKAALKRANAEHQKRLVVVVLGAISLLSSLGVAYYIFWDKQLRANHSNVLIALLSLFSFGLGFYALLAAIGQAGVTFICYSHIDQVYITTWWVIYRIGEVLITYPFYWLLTGFQQYRFDAGPYGQYFNPKEGATEDELAKFEENVHIDAKKALVAMIRINHNCFLVLCVTINIIICVDMYLSFRSPFRPAAKRLSAYCIVLALSLLICLINKPWLADPVEAFKLTAGSSFFYTTSNDFTLEEFGRQLREVLRDDPEIQHYQAALFAQLRVMDSGLGNNAKSKLFVNCIFLSVFMAAAFGSIGYAQKLRMKISNEDRGAMLQRDYLRKHISYVAVCIVLWALFLSISFYKLYNASQQAIDTDELKKMKCFAVGDQKTKDEKCNEQDTEETLEALAPVYQRVVQTGLGEWFFYATIIISILQGFIILLMRIREPYYWYIMKREFYSWLGKILDDQETAGALNEKSQNLALQMNSQLSEDFLYCILYSIVNNTAGVDKTQDRGHGAIAWDDYGGYDYKSTNETLIEFLVTKDTTEIKKELKKKEAEVALEQKVIERDGEVVTAGQRRKSISMSQIPSVEVIPVEIDINKPQQHFIDMNIVCNEFAPDVFAQLRAQDGYKLDSFQESLDPEIEKNIGQITKAGEGLGKSGSFFFKSHDCKFFIKSLSKQDFTSIRRLLKGYFEYINHPHVDADGKKKSDTKRRSLLARIYGLYSVKMGESEPVYLILQGNVTQCDDNYIKSRFDLKGSIVNREVKKENRANTDLLMDTNFLQLKAKELVMLFSPDDIKHIVDQIGTDISLLQAHNVVDYSLLLAIEYNPKYVQLHPNEFDKDKAGRLKVPIAASKKQEKLMEEAANMNFSSTKQKKQSVEDEFMKELTAQTKEDFQQRYLARLGEKDNVDEGKGGRAFKQSEKKQRRLRDTNPELYRQLALNIKTDNPHNFMSDNGKYIYHIGIIDYLQDYNSEKRIENQYKSIMYGARRITIVPPKQYAERFFEFQQSQVIINQEVPGSVRSQARFDVMARVFETTMFENRRESQIRKDTMYS